MKDREPPSKEDLATKREMQMHSLRYDLSTAKTLKELVLYEINAGFSAEWIATKYGHMGASLDRVKAFKAAIDRQSEAKRERTEAARGASDVRAVQPDGVVRPNDLPVLDGSESDDGSAPRLLQGLA